jgi:predicted Ser/Thr protein kinase
VSDAQLQAAIDRRISDFSRDVCERVRLGEITDTEANELTNEFVDRMYSQGPWS